MTTSVEHIPVMVVGGGPAGAAAALTLARRGHRVLLADAARSRGRPVGESLAPVARSLLAELGVLESFVADGHRPCYGNVSSWGSDAAYEADSVFDPHGHGWHVDRVRFDAMVRRAARGAGAEVILGARVADVRAAGGGGWRVTLVGADGAREVRIGWLVDATGRRALVARSAGAARLATDALVAFHAVLARPGGAGPDHDARTTVEAVPDGWWYTAPVPGGERVVAFLTDVDLARRDVLLSPQGFAARLRESRHVSRTVERGAWALRDGPRGADARSHRLDRFVGGGWLAVGDASMAFDPLSSQGLLNALYTGLRAGQALDEVLARGSPSPLERYAAELEGVYAAYRRNLSAVYAAEPRWTERVFWARRHAGAVATA